MTPVGDNAATQFINAAFHPEDSLAVVLLNKRTGAVVQRIGKASKIAGEEFQGWLHDKNAQGFDIYISMNALKDAATGRTKRDVATIRHIYLDFDEDGTVAVQRLLQRKDLPAPSFVVNTSPDKWQVIWNVEGFAKDQAESLQKGLARETGADPAATDCARVLRLPGFQNHKYGKPFLIVFEMHAPDRYGPERFPNRPESPQPLRERGHEPHLAIHKDGRTRQLSQSERDWSYAKRALARGESPAAVVATIASYRRFDKHNPQYYADLTVSKAMEALRAEGRQGANQRSPQER